jgi:hypothetical protein
MIALKGIGADGIIGVNLIAIALAAGGVALATIGRAQGNAS